MNFKPKMFANRTKEDAAREKTKEGRAKNRRVEIEVVGSRKN